MYALVEIKGRQYKAEQGAVLKVDRLQGEKGASVEFPTVLMVSDGDAVKIGSPFLDGISVKAVLEGHGRGRKILVGKFKKKKNYRRKKGHRQQYSLIKVESIQGLG